MCDFGWSQEMISDYYRSLLGLSFLLAITFIHPVAVVRIPCKL